MKINYNKRARKILLPHLVVTEVVSAADDGAIPIALPALGESSSGETYYIRPMKVEGESERR